MFFVCCFVCYSPEAQPVYIIVNDIYMFYTDTGSLNAPSTSNRLLNFLGLGAQVNIGWEVLSWARNGGLKWYRAFKDYGACTGNALFRLVQTNMHAYASIIYLDRIAS